MTKDEVRILAEKYNLPNKSRKDSQGICFLGKIKFDEFLRYNLGEKEGDLIEFETKEVLGKHKGFWFYTIGQRRGSGLGGGPWYVVSKDPEKNIVYISRKYYDDEKRRDELYVQNINWILEKEPKEKELFVKLRHGKQKHKCIISKDGDQLHVKLSERDQGIAAGQFAVFYKENECLGCGVIV